MFCVLSCRQTGFEVGGADVDLDLECVGGGSGSSMEGDWVDPPRTSSWSDEPVECGESSDSIQLLLDREV